MTYNIYKTLKIPPQKTVRIKYFSKLSGYKNQLPFLFTNKLSERGIKKTISFTVSIEKNKVLWKRFKLEGERPVQ